MKIIPFMPEHLQQMDIQDAQTLFEAEMNSGEYAASLSAHGGWTGMRGDEVVACAGLIPIWKGRFGAWSVISRSIGPDGMLSLTRAIRRGLAMQPGRVEIIVAEGFEEGHRWARMHGFTLDTPVVMQGFFPDGSGAFQYSRISHG